MTLYYRVFSTALGDMAVGWTPDGITRFRLPGDDVDAMAERFERDGFSEARTGQGALVARIVAYAEGAQDDFRDVPVDLSAVTATNRRIYAYIRDLGWGETTTYGAIARWLGDIALSRAVGAAMGANPVPLIIPCHRVMAADGRTGGFSAPGGVESKLRLLALENAAAPDGQLSLGL